MAGKIGRTELTLPGGENVSAMAPVIVSASRSTDIPAFFAKSFMPRVDNLGKSLQPRRKLCFV